MVIVLSNQMPDVLGRKLEDAVLCLNNFAKEYIIEYTHPVTRNKNLLMSEVAYVVRQKSGTDKTVLLVANQMGKEV